MARHPPAQSESRRVDRRSDDASRRRHSSPRRRRRTRPLRPRCNRACERDAVVDRVARPQRRQRAQRLRADREEGSPADCAFRERRRVRSRQPRVDQAAAERRHRVGILRVVRGQRSRLSLPSIASIPPRPTVAMLSGLYELFGDNDLVSRSLAGIADAVAPGGFLIYTCQPWHPQLELIARALTSHRGGAAWVMRRRTQNEMDQLAERAGFRKIAQRIDEWGIFTVSLAVRA